MNILVTGGAGFIGCNFIRYELNTYQDNIICVDNLTYAGNLNNLKDVLDDSKFKFIKADITDKEAMEKVFKNENIDVVINFAAESHVDRSIESPDIFIKTNVLGTQILLNLSLKYKVKRFHQVSTDEVYGDLSLDSSDSFTEESPLRASSPYAASKASADLLTLAYKRTYGLPISISRSSNNYGPYQHKEKFIPMIIDNARGNKEIPIYGDGNNVRDWIYVEDNCKAIDLIARKGKDGEIYNVGSGNAISNIELAKMILDSLGKDYSLLKFVEDRKGHDLKYCINFDKLKNDFEWQPISGFHNLNDIINKI